MQTKTIAMILLIAIATLGAIGIGTAIQSAQAFFGGFGHETNPLKGNPHPSGEPTGNAHQFPTCT